MSAQNESNDLDRLSIRELALLVLSNSVKIQLELTRLSANSRGASEARGGPTQSVPAALIPSDRQSAILSYKCARLLLTSGCPSVQHLETELKALVNPRDLSCIKHAGPLNLLGDAQKNCYILVVHLPDVSSAEWSQRLASSKAFAAVDTSFPLSLETSPWEVSLQKAVDNTKSPVWCYNAVKPATVFFSGLPEAQSTSTAPIVPALKMPSSQSIPGNEQHTGGSHENEIIANRLPLPSVGMKRQSVKQETIVTDRDAGDGESVASASAESIRSSLCNLPLAPVRRGRA